jgi:hypothetical protein
MTTRRLAGINFGQTPSHKERDIRKWDGWKTGAGAAAAAGAAAGEGDGADSALPRRKVGAD